MEGTLPYQRDEMESEPLISTLDFIIGPREGQQVQVPNVEVEFSNLYPGKTFYKRQCRKKSKQYSRQDKKGRQIVENGVVNMTAKYGREQLLSIRGWVRREPHAALLYEDRNGEVLICGDDNKEMNLVKENDLAKFTTDGHTLQPFSVDLGEIYDGPFQPVFELSRANMEKVNKFQLLIQLVFVDGQTSTKFVSPTFVCCTKKRNFQDDTSAGHGEPMHQRVRNDSGESLLHVNSPCSSGDSGILDNSQRHKHILVDTLDAKTANIKELVCDTISTSSADIAYHLRLKNPLLGGPLEEGDIVGFYVDEKGETYIQKLQSGNIKNAVHAGVISRSYWMEGNKPSKSGETDTVCVIGIVHVKVMGCIENGERIYASQDRPGKAVSQSHVPVSSFLRKKHVLLGMALEGKKCSKPDEVNLVKCFVCIVLDVSRQELLEEIEELYEVNETRTEAQIKLHSKKTWRRLKCCFGITVILLGLIIFVFYQWLAPGSLFRYWLCRRGSIPNHELNFKFKDVNNRLLNVHGLEFTITALQEKVGVKFEEHVDKNRTAHYYLNIDRCAYYWDDGATGNNIGGHKYIGGSRILSVFRPNCSVVYECKEMEQNPWDKISQQSNVVCTPEL